MAPAVGVDVDVLTLHVEVDVGDGAEVAGLERPSGRSAVVVAAAGAAALLRRALVLHRLVLGAEELAEELGVVHLPEAGQLADADGRVELEVAADLGEVELLAAATRRLSRWRILTFISPAIFTP